MSLASAALLLQTALSLLTLVNSNPSLPQSLRDHATVVAEQAISEAHAALEAQGASVQAAPVNASSMQTMSMAAASRTKAGPAYVYPNPALTPGAVLTTDAATICTTGYAASVRDVSTATKKQVYAEYGVSYPQLLGAFEVDHFIPLEIGGSNDLANLWLEAATPTPGFHQKDQFENFEHDEVCRAAISVPEAQRRMVSDWYFYWRQEVGGVTTTTSGVQFVSVPVPAAAAAAAPAPQTATTPEASGAYYTSSYHGATYWYPASCSGWHGLSKAYLETFPTLEALLAKYPGRVESPGCL